MIAARTLGVLADSSLRRSGAALISQGADRFFGLVGIWFCRNWGGL